jgi:hypothetical protein
MTKNLTAPFIPPLELARLTCRRGDIGYLLVSNFHAATARGLWMG